MIGQLPKEAGGNYTTGASNVVYELSKQKIDDLKLYTFATNASMQAVSQNSMFPNQYMGYTKQVGELLKDVIQRPIKTCKEWNHYIFVDHENPIRFSFYKKNIQRAIDRVHPELIHVHSIRQVSVTRFAIGDRSIPILLTCHGVFFNGDIKDTKGRDIYQGNLPLCDYYTGLTEEARHEFTDILGVSPKKYTIIPNGVDTQKFYYSEDWRNRIRKEMGIKDSTKVFITVASLQERKGQLAFIKILEQLDFDYQYWLVGLGPDKESIESYVVEHQLEEKVKVLGYRNSVELYKYYSAADIYAHPSWKEGQALCEIEAHATGLRTLVNDAVAGTIPDLKDGDYYVMNFDNVDKVGLHNWVAKNVENRKSKTTYDWSQILNYYYKLYKTIHQNYELYRSE